MMGNANLTPFTTYHLQLSFTSFNFFIMKNATILLVLCFISHTLLAQTPVGRRAAGATPADIQGAIDQFRTDLGGANNGIGNTFTTGRREINWDGVPDAFAQPNNLPPDFFNVNSPRGLVMRAVGEKEETEGFRVSADSDNPTQTATKFADISTSFATQFKAFTEQRVFSYLDHKEIAIRFFVPGTQTIAAVRGFGAVFCDVDMAQVSSIELFQGKKSLGKFYAQPTNAGLSFVGVSFPTAIVTKVIITTGNTPVQVSCGPNPESSTKDMVVLDDFIYGEPQAVQQ